jgi:hypothetical protein
VYERGDSTLRTALRAGGYFLGQSMCFNTLNQELSRIELRAVDLAGNESAGGPEQSLSSCGCAAGGGGAGAALALGCALLLVAARRRSLGLRTSS